MLHFFQYTSNQQMRLHCSKSHPKYVLPPPGTIMNINAIKKNAELNKMHNVNFELTPILPKLGLASKVPEV